MRVLALPPYISENVITIIGLTRRDGTAVIVDFDSCVAEGTSLERVGRTEGWHNPTVRVAQPSNDRNAIYEIEEWISDKKVKHYRFGN